MNQSSAMGLGMRAIRFLSLIPQMRAKIELSLQSASARAPANSAIRSKARSAQNECTQGRIFLESLNVGETGAKCRLNLGSRAVPQLHPDNLRRASPQHAHVVVVFVFGHNGKPGLASVIPNAIVIGAIQPCRLHVARAGKQIDQAVDQLQRQVLVEKQLHGAAINMLRSRSAAKAKQAWISSGVRYWKSSRISAT